MKDLGKILLRILLALVIGGAGAELINVLSDDPNHYHTPDRSNSYTMIIGVIAFLVLTFALPKKKL